MSPARRTALISVLAAVFLIALKLGVGLATNSLGFLSEALHSGTDLVAALLTFFAIGLAHKPADATHAWGHGKAEHLSALAECVVLAIASVLIGIVAVRRLAADVPAEVYATWWAFAALAVVIGVDLSRTVISLRSARRHRSAALASNALHFAGDLAGTAAVLAGLVLTRAGVHKADAAASLLVGVMVLVAAVRMARVNVDVLMDRTPFEAEQSARRAIATLGPDITLERLRMREAAGTQFADVVISVAPSAALAEGHAAADAVEAAIRNDLANADVVVHVEPRPADDASLREQVLSAALSVPGVREIHNVRIFDGGASATASLHVKLPSDTPLVAAHEVATAVEAAIVGACPRIADVATHLEPLHDPTVGRATSRTETARLAAHVGAVVAELSGRPPNDVRFTNTEDGLVAFVDIALDPGCSLARAHDIGGAVRGRLRREIAELDDALVHTEPAADPDG